MDRAYFNKKTTVSRGRMWQKHNASTMYITTVVQTNVQDQTTVTFSCFGLEGNIIYLDTSEGW